MSDNERLAAEFRQQNRSGDGKPKGTLESLERCAAMLDTYAPECFPANENGQIHFARAMMEGVADEIRAYLAEQQAATVKALLTDMRKYVIYHGLLIGECVAWNKLKAMFGVEES